MYHNSNMYDVMYIIYIVIIELPEQLYCYSIATEIVSQQIPSNEYRNRFNITRQQQ